MSVIDTVFGQLRQQKRSAFMPFITAGDPDLDFTADVLHALAGQSADLIEIGIPYSDPIADGPVIQASYTRAFDRGIRVRDIFRMLEQVTQDITIPVVTMVSYAIILRHGPREYVEAAQAAGVAGAIVPDLPVDEAEGLATLCHETDFSLIQLVAPTTPRDRALRIAKMSRGFLYYVSVTGITGERTALPPELADNVAWLRDHVLLPICIGFGIRGPETVRQLASAADGLIVGSAFVRRIAEAATRPRHEVLEEVKQFAAELVGALKLS